MCQRLSDFKIFNASDVHADFDVDDDDYGGIDGRIRYASKLHDSYTTQQLHFNFVPG